MFRAKIRKKLYTPVSPSFFSVQFDNFQLKNVVFILIFAQNIDRGRAFVVAVLTSTNNLCFSTKIRKNVYPCG